MGLSSAAARCGLYTASRIGFSSNRQLSVLPALNAYKPTLHVLFFCFVSHYSSAACNIQFIFQENLSWSAHPRGAFLSYGNEVSYTIKKLPPGSFPSDGSFLSALFSQQTENVPLFHFVHRFYRFKAVLRGNYSPS